MYNFDNNASTREKEKSSPSDEEKQTTPPNEDQESIQPYDIESIPLSRSVDEKRKILEK